MARKKTTKRGAPPAGQQPDQAPSQAETAPETEGSGDEVVDDPVEEDDAPAPAAPSKQIQVMARIEGSYHSIRKRAGDVFYLRLNDPVPDWCVEIEEAKKQNLLGGKPDAQGVMRPQGQLLAGQSKFAAENLIKQAKLQQERDAAAAAAKAGAAPVPHQKGGAR